MRTRRWQPTCSADGSLVFWDTATGKERGRVSVAALGPAGYVSSMFSAIAFAPDGKTLAAAPQDQTVRLLDVATKKEKERPARATAGPLGCDHSSNVICADNTGMLTWDLTTGKETRRLGPHDARPAQVALAPYAFAPNGKWLPSAFRLPPSAFCLLPSGRGHVQRITALAFSTDSRYLVSGSQATSTLVWDLAEVGK